MVLKVKVSPDVIDGDVAEGYGKIADVFRANFAGGREVGAAVSVYRDGVKVADHWPEFAQTGRGEITVRQLLGHQDGVNATKCWGSRSASRWGYPNRGSAASSVSRMPLMAHRVWRVFRLRRRRSRYRFRLRDEPPGFHLYSDPRELALRRALFCDVLGARPQT